MPSLLDFLEPRYITPSGALARSFDTPVRTPLINQGGRPPGPQRLSGRELRQLTQPPLALVEVREVNRYADSVPVQFSIGTAGIAGAQQILVKNERDRILLCFRNQALSAGVVLVGLGTAPDVNSASFAVPVNGLLLFDIVIPQNDIWIATDVAPTSGVLTYALSDFAV